METDTQNKKLKCCVGSAWVEFCPGSYGNTENTIVIDLKPRMPPSPFPRGGRGRANLKELLGTFWARKEQRINQ